MLEGYIGKLSMRIPSFVLNLYRILSEPKYSDMIAWERSGTRFIIKDTLSFASKVLPKYYETSKFTSFSRQLNIYGFHRISDRRRTKQSSEASTIIYSHQHFKRDHPDSLHLIQRMVGPYSQARTRYSIQEANTKPALPLSLPSPISPVLPSFSAINLQPISQHECESKRTNAPVDACSNCAILKQEMIALSKLIEYYKFLVSEPFILGSMKLKKTTVGHDHAPTTNQYTDVLSAPCAIPLSSCTLSNFNTDIHSNNYANLLALEDISLFPNVAYL
ncbi:hypothetical protein K7432_006463 [Basidiobolus ranarum]|uniref:HSF-type DNA-binding domain-containing protein n=1 Tax=Basidiobolus ranarum TaxID=34480 RepID=A0ABR2WUY7_9FUNG